MCPPCDTEIHLISLWGEQRTSLHYRMDYGFVSAGALRQHSCRLVKRPRRVYAREPCMPIDPEMR
jgi:hypothetical protein